MLHILSLSAFISDVYVSYSHAKDIKVQDEDYLSFEKGGKRQGSSPCPSWFS